MPDCSLTSWEARYECECVGVGVSVLCVLSVCVRARLCISEEPAGSCQTAASLPGREGACVCGVQVCVLSLYLSLSLSLSLSPPPPPPPHTSQGVGSQGDGAAQFLCKSARDQDAVITVLKEDFDMQGLKLTVAHGIFFLFVCVHVHECIYVCMYVCVCMT